MEREKIIVPLKRNKCYYDGLRGMLSGTFYSMLGVYFTALMITPLTLKELMGGEFLVVHAWIIISFVLWRRSLTTPNRVVFSIGKIWYYPNVANIILGAQYIVIGILCSLIFDCFSKINVGMDHLTAFYWVALVYLILLLLFCSLSIRKFEPVPASNDQQSS
ncbi:hypothetical protein JT31_02005 [Cedecea neteri]|jgi:hypothetical protein|uniref:Uncharacterized protein n=1 Tax=Cedecea neteri TaxID=158822 RepID=A0A089PTW9_9ENTR|nr:hypothetical protein [Cedecea neteri]AIR03433.1 hypothetical protein JT31_02005 [Cedecea neteri]